MANESVWAFRQAVEEGSRQEETKSLDRVRKGPYRFRTFCEFCKLEVKLIKVKGEGYHWEHQLTGRFTNADDAFAFMDEHPERFRVVKVRE